MVGKFVGVGVGPGDPELITVKAVKALKAADVICVPKSHANKPSMALSMVKQVLEERAKPPEVLELVFPMTKDELDVKRLWAENAVIVTAKVDAGKVVVFITLGDPMLYSTFLYLYRSLREGHPNVRLEIIPGVTSVTAAAASAKLPLAERDEVVSILPSDLDSGLIEETARHADNLVFMKCAHRLKELVPILEEAGFTENSMVALVKRCTLPEEKVVVGRLGDVQNWDICKDYFSVAIIKRTELPVDKEKGDVL
ncbi:MAG: precorrin-2 C(20)-methyltransferase [Candidatus Bathyarchaeota archaeon]|nr:precorrin-2 C(20)-methyltransferase [Candidatus Bathyarchaeota archaeon]